MNNKLLYGVMTAQLLIMGVTQYQNNEVVGIKVAEINEQNKVIAGFKGTDRLQKSVIEKMSVELDEKTASMNDVNAKLAESERLRSEQDANVKSQEGKITQQQTIINQLKAELAEAQKPEPQAQPQVQEQELAKTDGRVLQMVATAYTNDPSENGTYGGKVVTRTGYDISNTITYNGMGIVAADTSVIPLNSIIDIEGLGRYIVLDTGSAINGNKLDVLMGSTTQSENWGRRTVNVTIVKRG